MVGGVRRSERGFVAIEFALAVGLLLLPVVMLVAALPSWVEREHAATVAPHVDKTDFAKHPEVLGNRGLFQIQAVHDLTDWSFLKCKKVENLEPARFGNGVESIRSCGCPRHMEMIHSHIGMCQEKSHP